MSKWDKLKCLRMRKRMFAFLLTAALIVPQGVYAAEVESGVVPVNGMEEVMPPIEEGVADNGEQPEREHEAGCILDPNHEGDCVTEPTTEQPEREHEAGCILDPKHEGDCVTESTTEQPEREHEAGCILEPNHEGDCVVEPTEPEIPQDHEDTEADVPTDSEADAAIDETAEVAADGTEQEELGVIDMSKGRVVITDTGYTQYTEGEEEPKEIPYTGEYVLTGKLDYTNTENRKDWDNYTRTAISIEGESEDSEFDITLKDLTVNLKHEYYCSTTGGDPKSSHWTYKGLIQLDQGTLNLNVKGENTLTIGATDDSYPAKREARIAGAPVIRVIKGNLNITGDGTLNLVNEDTIENHDCSGGIYVHRGNLDIDMGGYLNISVSKLNDDSESAHIVCGVDLELNDDISKGNCKESWEDSSVQGNDIDKGIITIENGNLCLGDPTADEMKPGCGISAYREFCMSGGNLRIFSNKGILTAGENATNYGFGHVEITGETTEVAIKNQELTRNAASLAGKASVAITDGATVSIDTNERGMNIISNPKEKASLNLSDCTLTVNSKKDCLYLRCDTAISGNSKVELRSDSGSGIRYEVEYNDNRDCAFEISGNSGVDIQAKSYGIYYNTPQKGSLEIGENAFVNITKGSTGIYSGKNIDISDQAIVSVLLENDSSEPIKAKGDIRVSCEELVAGSLPSAVKAVQAGQLTITDMQYVPLEEDTNYYKEGMGVRNKIYASDGEDETEPMTGAYSSPYLYVKRDHPTITITPVDMTLYIGGTSSYWEDMEGNQLPNTNSGIPAPHFYVTTSNNTSVDDVIFTAKGADDTLKAWKVEKYGDDAWNIVSVDENAADASCMYFADETLKERVNVDDINDNHFTTLYTTVATEDQSGASNTGFGATIHGKNYELIFGTGTLKVRSITQDAQESDDYAFDVTTGGGTTLEAVKADAAAAAEATAQGTKPGIVVPQDTTYTVNGKEGWTLVGNQPSLLFDNVLSSYELDQNGEVGENILTTAIASNAADLGLDSMQDRKYDAKYLDLVDTADGNVWIQANNAAVVYWPYPEGTNPQDYTFDLFHFTGLHREYTTTADVQNLVNQAVANIGNVQGKPSAHDTVALMKEPIELTENGIQFVVDQNQFGFSPFVLTWVPKDSGGGSNGGSGGGGGHTSNTYYVIYHPENESEEKEYKDGKFIPGQEVEAKSGSIFTAPDGMEFAGWSEEPGGTVRYEANDVFRMPGRHYHLYAVWVPMLNQETHDAYIAGYEDGSVRPGNLITREEVAAIFFRLLNDSTREAYFTTENPYPDVAADRWSNIDIATLSNAHILYGRPDGNFDPKAPITRAEFAAIAARFDNGTANGSKTFSDVHGHWAENQILRAAELGWISGYPDGTFAPERYITRAEAVSLINRVLERIPESKDDLLENMKTWVDNQDENMWYYLPIQEATNSHDYEKKTGSKYETWTELLPERNWSELRDPSRY